MTGTTDIITKCVESWTQRHSQSEVLFLGIMVAGVEFPAPSREDIDPKRQVLVEAIVAQAVQL